MVEERTWLKRVFLGVTVFGAAYGLSLFVPLVINPDWLSIEIAQGSIVYDTRLIYDDFVSKSVLRIVYASVICLPLLASTAPGVRSFGRMVMLSVLLAFLFALYAFTVALPFGKAARLVAVAQMIFVRQDKHSAPASYPRAELARFPSVLHWKDLVGAGCRERPLAPAGWLSLLMGECCLRSS
jgi:hypothetical protein